MPTNMVERIACILRAQTRPLNAGEIMHQLNAEFGIKTTKGTVLNRLAEMAVRRQIRRVHRGQYEAVR